jgi:hypothetical protein
MDPEVRAAYQQSGALKTTLNGTDVWLINVIGGRIFGPILGPAWAEHFVGSQPVTWVATV